MTTEVPPNLEFLFQAINDTGQLREFLALIAQDVDNDRRAKYSALIVAYFIIMMISLLGNTLVCFVIFRSKTQRNLTNMSLGNLAIADLFITVLNVPFGCARFVMGDWIFGNLLCSLLPFVQVTSVYVSSLTMTLIAIDRYQAMMRPLAPKLGDYYSPLLIVVCIWLTSIVLALPYSMFNSVEKQFTYRTVIRCQVHYPEPEWLYRRSINLFTFVTQCLVPLSISGVAYFRIGWRIWFRQTIGHHTKNQLDSSRRDKIKTLTMLITCFAIFAICWLPISIYHFLVDFGMLEPSFYALVANHLVAMSSVCYNPFIYFWFNDTFRDLINRTLCFKRRPERTVSTPSTSLRRPNRRKLSSAFAVWSDETNASPLGAITV